MPRLAAPEGASVPLDVRDPDVVRALADTVAILDADLRPRIILGAMATTAGYRPVDANAQLGDWVHPEDQAAVGAAVLRAREVPGVDVDVHARVRNDVEGWHAVTLVFRDLLDHPDVQGVLVRAVDQTVFQREARWRTLMQETPIGIFELDLDDHCTFVNHAFERLTGLRASDALGDGWWRVFDRDDIANMKRDLRTADDRDAPTQHEMRIVALDGSRRWVHARSVPLRGTDSVVTSFLVTLEDITDRKELEERLEHDATHDRLTGLGSRALLVEHLRAALARTRRGGPGVAVIFVDLDRFKRVNDMLGHSAGDALLVQVADRLRWSVRETDVCIRLGGDEFVVCGADIDSHISSLQLGDRLLAAIGAPYDVHGHEVLVSASIGIAMACGDDPVSVDQILSNADIAAYRAKRMGRGRVELFDDELRRELANSRRVARGVGRVLNEPSVPLRCTPIVHLATTAVVGFECDVDWASCNVRVPDDELGAVLDEAGMSRTRDMALLRTVLFQLAEWERCPPGDIVPGLAVALSTVGALSPLTPELVRTLLIRSGARPARCWLGVPEAAVAHDFDVASAVATELDQLGVGVALRDFGSAVSSLDQLRRLPAPTISVAGALVEASQAGAAGDPAGGALLAAIVRYARALGRVVVAFDVQDADHAQRLAALGCEFGVGPAFGPPLRPDEIPSYLARRR